MDHTYWRVQKPSKPLFPDLEWSKPVRRDQAGKLGIIGGNKLGFAAVAESYGTALNTGAGQVRVLLPDCLKKSLPAITDAIYAPCNPSGSLSSDAHNDLAALGAWADEILLIGDAGRNSETAILYEKFITDYTGQLVVTRDAIDLVKNAAHLLVDRPDTMLVASFAQIQKLFRSVYYPKVLTFSMQLQQLVEALHKFTITYPTTIVTLHKDQLVIAHGGDVITEGFSEPMQIWRGTTATRAATYWLWSQGKPLEASAASIH
ncbi:MAG TPA: hypothetical protein VFQ70_02830 [Candidatus Saccharimonadaceae bacterium]|nr:hypothetical protein [Candidatus Saccharimonadaceae bacterium]